MTPSTVPQRRGLRLLLLALAALAGCGGGGGNDGGGDGARPTATPAARAPATPAPARRSAPARGLAVGITEPNPALVWSPAARAVPPPFALWRDALAAIRPAYYRLVLDWPSLQPSAGRPADLAAPNGGCMRRILPCAPFAGVREQLQALASRQREGGWEGVVVIAGSPRWAAGPRAGCERIGTDARSRAPRPEALAAYGRLVRGVLAEARRAGARLKWWSAWNEPNRSVSFSPQRGRCRPRAPSVAADLYAELVRTLERALDAEPGDQELLLGDLAGVVEPDLGDTTVGEFLRGLPSDIVCRASAYALHSNVGSRDPVPAARAALAARGCRGRRELWITQTGALLRRGVPQKWSAAACRALHARLVRWHRDPSVTVAMQYTFREDDAFRMGLADSRLRVPRPALGEWSGWGAQRRDSPSDPPPEPSCRAPRINGS